MLRLCLPPVLRTPAWYLHTYRLAGTLQTKGIPHTGHVGGAGQQWTWHCWDLAKGKEEYAHWDAAAAWSVLMGCCKSQKRLGSLYRVLRGSKIVRTLTRTRRSRKCHVTLTYSPNQPPTELSMDLSSAACSPLCHLSGNVVQVTCTHAASWFSRRALWDHTARCDDLEHVKVALTDQNMIFLNSHKHAAR